MENKRLLLIIDPQIDFISGTLPVPNAGEVMAELARYVANQGSDYTAIVATTDWHPYHHMSFASENGPWPVHCVQNSTGAALPDDLIAACSNSGCPFVVLRKGNSADREEYSIMQNAASAALLDEIIGKEGITEIHVCGLAGNICVLNTLRDLVGKYGKAMLRVLADYAPSLDDGTELAQYLSENGIITLRSRM